MDENRIIREAVVESMTATKRGQEAPDTTHTNARDVLTEERQRMATEVMELQKRFDTRLAHQKQVIENLDTARKTAEEKLAAWHEFGRYVAALTPSVFYDLSCQALELLHQQGVEE